MFFKAVLLYEVHAALLKGFLSSKLIFRVSDFNKSDADFSLLSMFYIKLHICSIDSFDYFFVVSISYLHCFVTDEVYALIFLTFFSVFSIFYFTSCIFEF